MSKARLVITAVVVEHRTPAEVARSYGVSRSWVYELLARHRAEGDAAFQPRSRRPNSSPTALPEATVELIVTVRKQLAEQGLDAGPDTIGWHLREHHLISVSAATIARYLTKRGMVVPAPQKRPKSSYIRFAAELPNQCWQADVTHYRLADGAEAEILTFLDDHSRYALSVTARHRISGDTVLTAFRRTCSTYGVPASTLTDNAMVFTTRYAGGQGGRNGFETELHRLGVVQKNSRPNHPTTCGKVERFQQTLKHWLAAQPDQPRAIAELQALIDVFLDIYNQHRPHRSLPHQATPVAAYTARPKATPIGRADGHHRVRADVIDTSGTVTLRVAGQLHHIGIGRTHARTRVLILIQDLHIHVVNAATGELLRQLTLDPSRNYQPTGAPKGPKRRQAEPQ
jgi:transposase InsO family protein